MKKQILLSLTLFQTLWSFSQLDSMERSFASIISAADMKDNLTYIASSSTEGRETGTPGLRKAAEYIAVKLGNYGLKPAGNAGMFYQNYKYVRDMSKDVTLFDSSQKFEYLKDFYVQSDVRRGLIYNKEIVFLGYGIDDKNFNDFAKDTNLADKVVIILNDEPLRGKKYIVSGNTEHSNWYNNLDLKIQRVLKYKPAALIIVDDAYASHLAARKQELSDNYLIMGSNSYKVLLPEGGKEVIFPVMFTHKGIAAKLLGMDSLKLEKVIQKTAKKHKPIHLFTHRQISMEVEKVESAPRSDNVIGYIEGTDLKDEYIVISAHFDHLGMHKGEIFYGADDNGSGTVALLEIAEAFAVAKRAGFTPRRSILFCAFSGEEKGLIGSEYYTKNPLLPLNKAMLDLNIDMIGRVDSTYSALKNSNYIYAIGTNRLSSDLKPILEKANTTYSHLTLDYKFDDPLDKNRFFYRSDHYNFAKYNIPVIFFFNGVHADYHKSTDTIDKINFNKMEAIARLVFHVAWQTANQTESIKRDLK